MFSGRLKYSAKCCLLSHRSKWIGSSFESKTAAYSTLHSPAKWYYCTSKKRQNMGCKSFNLPSRVTSVRLWTGPSHVWKCWRQRCWR